MTERDMSLHSENTIQYTDDVLQNCTLEIYIILLTSVIPLHSIQILKKELYIPHFLTALGTLQCLQRTECLHCAVLCCGFFFCFSFGDLGPTFIIFYL